MFAIFYQRILVVFEFILYQSMLYIRTDIDKHCPEAMNNYIYYTDSGVWTRVHVMYMNLRRRYVYMNIYVYPCVRAGPALLGCMTLITCIFGCTHTHITKRQKALFSL